MNASRTAAHPRASFAALVAAVFALVAVVVAANASAAPKAAQVKVAKTKLGSILVNSKGMTLYMFAADKHGKSACYGQCASYWPPLLAGSAHVSGAGVKSALLGTTKRTDGKLQVTYNKRPLYTYVGDKKPGQASGQGVNVSGGLWWVMSPAGAVVKRTAAAATSSSSTTTSPGYSYGG
jgi:predicted lipoprotein with Yx(FWY)xxD motif